MESTPQLEEDLAFVRGAIRRMERRRGVPAIYLLWSVLIPVGFALPDLAPRWTGLYWAVIAPVGGVASWFIGWFAARRRGTMDRGLGRRYALHWLVLGIAFALAALPGVVGGLSGQVIGAYMLLIAGTGYLLTAVHLDRGLAASGVLMLIGFAMLATLRMPWVWTATGVLVSAALFMAAISAGRSSGSLDRDG